jgi:hypothetical protein
MTRPKKSKSKAGTSDKPISLAPLDFETAVRAAMATGRPPKVKAKKRQVRK